MNWVHMYSYVCKVWSSVSQKCGFLKQNGVIQYLKYETKTQNDIQLYDEVPNYCNW